MKKKSSPLVDAAPEQGASGERCSVAVGSALKTRVCEIIRKHGEGRGGVAITDIALRAKTTRLACNSVLRAMERRGEAGQYNSSRDRWGCQTWYLIEPNNKMSNSDPLLTL